MLLCTKICRSVPHILQLDLLVLPAKARGARLSAVVGPRVGHVFVAGAPAARPERGQQRPEDGQADAQHGQVRLNRREEVGVDHGAGQVAL